MAGGVGRCVGEGLPNRDVLRRCEQILHRNVQRFRGELVFKAHTLCVSLNSRLESNEEEEEMCSDDDGAVWRGQGGARRRGEFGFTVPRQGRESMPSWNRGARGAALKERCPPRQKSRVERLKAKVEPLLTYKQQWITESKSAPTTNVLPGGIGGGAGWGAKKSFRAKGCGVQGYLAHKKHPSP